MIFIVGKNMEFTSKFFEQIIKGIILSINKQIPIWGLGRKSPRWPPMISTVWESSSCEIVFL